MESVYRTEEKVVEEILKQSFILLYYCCRDVLITFVV